MNFYTIIGALLLTSLFISRAGAQSDKDDAVIRASLQAQARAWNNADLDGFMSYYLRSEQLKFVSKSGVQYGWQPLYERYRKNYPGKEGMGRLQFEVIENERLAAGVYQMIGRWELKRTAKDGSEETLGGYFTLTWRKVKGRWLIVADHTS
ncbi:YybH family protein [Rhodoflexus sp.]